MNRNIVLIVLAGVLSLFVVMTGCQKAQDENKPQAVSQEVTTDVLSEETQTTENNAKVSEETSAEPKRVPTNSNEYLPEKCKQLIEKDKSARLNVKELDYLWHECHYPAHSFPTDVLKIYMWWKPEYGHEDMIIELSKNLLEDLEMNMFEDELSQKYIAESAGAVGNLALNSDSRELRYLTIRCYTYMKQGDSVASLKKFLNKEFGDVPRYTEEQRKLVGFICDALTMYGDYEYAFPYMMRMGYFNHSTDKLDKRAIPYMQEALDDKDFRVRVDAANGLIKFGLAKEDAFRTLTDFIESTNSRSKDYDSGIPAYRSFAIKGLGELGDPQAIPVLEEALKYTGSSQDKLIYITINHIKEQAR